MTCRDGPAKKGTAVQFRRIAQLFHPWNPPHETTQALNIKLKASVKSVS